MDFDYLILKLKNNNVDKQFEMILDHSKSHIEFLLDILKFHCTTEKIPSIVEKKIQKNEKIYLNALEVSLGDYSKTVEKIKSGEGDFKEFQLKSFKNNPLYKPIDQRNTININYFPINLHINFDWMTVMINILSMVNLLFFLLYYFRGFVKNTTICITHYIYCIVYVLYS